MEKRKGMFIQVKYNGGFLLFYNCPEREDRILAGQPKRFVFTSGEVDYFANAFFKKA